MGSAKRGKVGEVRELLALRADVTLTNGQGLTALQLTRAAYGGVIPPSLEELLVAGL